MRTRQWSRVRRHGRSRAFSPNQESNASRTSSRLALPTAAGCPALLAHPGGVRSVAPQTSTSFYQRWSLYPRIRAWVAHALRSTPGSGDLLHPRLWHALGGERSVGEALGAEELL